MKELSEERATQLHDKHWIDEATPTRADISMLQEAYRLGQQEAGVDEQRFQAACAALSGVMANHSITQAISGNDGVTPVPDLIARIVVTTADALIAELNRTASDAEKGGEHE